MKFIGYMRGLSLGYALSAENSAFEVCHVQDVAYYSEKLAYERDLDQNIALAIAYGHDLGRTRLGEIGKNHARVSAKFMKALMENSDFDLETQDIIGHAIKKHNIKARCHGVYDELIKDADALAHLDEGLIGDDDHVESYRATLSTTMGFSIDVAPLEIWCNQFEAMRASFLQNMIQLEAFKSDPRHWVHEQRKNVRKLRSMIWYLKIGITENRFDELDKLLKRFFGDTSGARMVQVQIDYLKTLSNKQSPISDEMKHQKLDEKLKLELDQIESQLTNGSYVELIRVFNQTFDLNGVYFEDPLINQNRWLKSFTAYLIRATKTDLKQLKKLHQLRIQGKKFKYMSDLGLLRFSSSTVASVIDCLHDHIGALNDFGDMKKMAQWQTIYDSSALDDQIISVQKLCKSELFFLVKLEQSIDLKYISIEQSYETGGL